MLNFRLCTICMLVAFLCYRQAFGYRVDFTKEQSNDDTNWKSVEFVAPSKYTGLWTLHDFVNRLRAEDAEEASTNSVHFPRRVPQDGQRSKRSISSTHPSGAESTNIQSVFSPEMLDISNEILTEQLLNAPLTQLDMELIEQTPWLKRLLIRNPQRLMYYVQEKRNHDFNPRLGRRSAEDCTEYPRQNYAPRLGKKDMQFTPRLGRDSSSG